MLSILLSITALTLLFVHAWHILNDKLFAQLAYNRLRQTQVHIKVIVIVRVQFKAKLTMIGTEYE
jgi:hypothetical protein